MKSQRSLLASLFLAGGATYLATRLLRPRISFRGATVLITGGSRGFGLAMARQFAAEGARLILVARDKAELQRAKSDLAPRGAVEVLTVAADVRQEDQVRHVLAECATFTSHLDVLINNAGAITVGPLESMTRGDFEDAMALHFWAPLLMMQEFMPLIARGRLKRIVNISSFGGKIAVPHMAPYCASKFALVGLSDAVRAETAKDGISVTTVCPGLIRSGSHLNAQFKGSFEEEFAWFSAGMAIPGSASTAEGAARQVLEAARAGQAELIITLQAQFAIKAQALFPNITASVVKWLDRLLPAAKGPSSRQTGWQSRGGLSPQARRRADQATENLNGMRGHTGADLAS